MKLFLKKHLIPLIIIALAAVVFVLAKIPSTSRALAPVCRAYTQAVGFLTSLAPFSLMSVLVLTLPVLAVFLIVRFIKSRKKLSFVLRFVAAIALVSILYSASFGFSYAAPSIYSHLSIDISEGQNSQKLLEAIDVLTADIIKLLPQIEFENYDEPQPPYSSTAQVSTAHTVSPLSFAETSKKIQDLYTAAGHDFLYTVALRPKAYFPNAFFPIYNIVGMYFPFFAEINVAAKIPPYELPATIAHEIAHSRGVTNEGECNYLAFIICSQSSDPYIRYSASMFGLTLLLNQLAAENRDLLKEKYEVLPFEVRHDFSYATSYYKQYDSFISDIGEFFNDLYLKGNNVPGGVKSYSAAAAAIIIALTAPSAKASGVLPPYI